MKKKSGVARSLVICLAVLVLMSGAGYILLSGENDESFVSSKVEAAFENLNGEAETEKKDAQVEEAEEEKNDNEEAKEEAQDDEEAKDNDEEVKEEPEELEEDKNLSEGQGEEVAAEEDSSGSAEKETSTSNAEAPVDHKEEQAAVEKQTESMPSESSSEEPATEPAVSEEVEEENEPEPEPEPEAVSYSWGASSSYVFRMEVAVSNNGSDTANNVTVSLPLLENRSPYQDTSLRSVNYNVVSNSGRVSTFKLGDISPGETKTIVADFDITVRPVSINSSNETIEKARQAYEQFAGSGNCRQLARGFINKSRELGIEAREVIGFARPERGPMTAGSLQGTRHSWAEFYVEGLGWVPVDLTFQYFGELPEPSHVVESYSDESISINYSGGSLSATWSNAIR